MAESSEDSLSLDPTMKDKTRLVSLSISASDDNEDLDVPSLLRKLNRHLLPISLLILFIGNLDRGNLGFAANQMCLDLNMTQTQYGTGASLFFSGYLISRVPSNVALRYFGASVWLAVILFLWAVNAGSFAFITTVPQFYILRFLLGITEGGAFPGVWYYLTGFYPDAYLNLPYTIMATAAPISYALSGPVAAIFFVKPSWYGIPAWRTLFFFEGFIPALMAPVIYFFIPKSIYKASFLTTDEQIWLRTKMDHETVDSQIPFVQELRTLLLSVPFCIITLFGIIHLALFSIITNWTTLIIEKAFANKTEDTGDTCASSSAAGLESILMTTAVFTIAAVATVSLGCYTHRAKNRSSIAGFLTIVSGLALASYALVDWKLDQAFCLISLTIAACGMNAPTGLYIGLLVSYFDAHIKSTCLSVFSALCSLGSIVAPIVTGAIVDRSDGDYSVATIVIGFVAFLGGLLLLTVRDPLLGQR